MTNKKEKLIEVSPKELCNWAGHDRHEFELDTEQTINSLLENGQTTPIIIRKCDDKIKIKKGINYEVIDGERRFQAAKKILNDNPNFKLKAILRDLSDKDAYVVQLIANEHSPLSGYSQALSYKKTLEQCGLKRHELASKLGIGNATLTRRMCFLEIDERLWAQIGNKRNVSTATAANLAVLLNKARKISNNIYEKTLNKLIAISDKIESATATRDIQKLYSELSVKNIEKIKKVYNADGELLFSISPAGSITINKLIFKKIDHEILEKKLSILISTLSNEKTLEEMTG